MHFEKINLTNFKNYESQTLELSERLNAFVGRNGMGKTNLLDAIYYLCLCKSYFLTADSDVILRGADFMRLEGWVRKYRGLEKIVAKVPLRKKKEMARNDVPYSTLSEHIGFLPVVMIAPDDIELVKEGSEARRRFLDNTLSQIDNQYLVQLMQYNKLLEQRNALLKKWASKGNSPNELTEDYDSLMGIYAQQMSPLVAYIYKKRQSFIRQFEPIFNALYQEIAAAQERVALVFESQLHTSESDDVDNYVRNLWIKSQEKDRVLQRTSIGIHRDDMRFLIDDKPLKKFGSQGQLKSFVIAMKLAQLEILRGGKAESPILLLDDIFDKLDENRVENLMQLITHQSFGQIFITDTHAERARSLFEKLGLPLALFSIKNGQVNRQD
jgi:DNA replication and repair protein RecF